MLCLKVKPGEKVFIIDSNGVEMDVIAKQLSAGQVALYFNAPKVITIDREKVFKRKLEDDKQLEVF